MRDRVPASLDEVGLRGFERRRPSRLSGGEQQRLALAGVLAPQPSVLVLDEPTANLDPAGTAALIERLARLRAERRATIVLVEHRVEQAWALADRVLALGRDGSPIAFGAPDDVVRRSGALIRDAGAWLPGDRMVGGSGRRQPVVGPPVVQADALTFAYPGAPPAVVGATLTVAAGERVALVGPNGSGKSTLGRLLVGLLSPSSGRVRLGGADPSRLAPAELARHAGYVFQDPERQFLGSTVAEEVRLGLQPEELRRAEELMVRLDLPFERFGDRSPYALSGGEQRRLSLACALVRQPRLLVLDEPTFGQDRLGFESLLAILRERVDDGVAVLAATHDDRLVGELAGRMVEIDGGRLTGGDAVPGDAT
jgi:energy-coupling factor transport system ATP-binding protein